MNVKWKDRRIERRRGFGRSVAAPGVDYRNNPDVYVPVDVSMMDSMWVPNLFVYDLVALHSPVWRPGGKRTATDGLWVATDGTVLFSQSVTLTLKCSMCLSAFPMDTHVCKMRFGSYSYDDTKMVFLTEADSGFFQGGRNRAALSFHVEIALLKDKIFDGGALGNFSLAGVEVHLSRKY